MGQNTRNKLKMIELLKVVITAQLQLQLKEKMGEGGRGLFTSIGWKEVYTIPSSTVMDGKDIYTISCKTRQIKYTRNMMCDREEPQNGR